MIGAAMVKENRKVGGTLGFKGEDVWPCLVVLTELAGKGNGWKINLHSAL
jgi:hypothetical protein